MWSECCNSIPLFRTSDMECCLRYCPSSWQCSAAYCSCNKDDSWSVFDGKWLITHHPSGLGSLRFSSLPSYETVIGGQHYDTMSCWLLINLSSMGLPISGLYVESLEMSFHGQRSTASLWFFKCDNLEVYIFLMHQVLLTVYEYFFRNFLPKLCVYSQYSII